MNLVKTLKPHQREVVLAAYHAKGEIDMEAHGNRLKALRVRGWIKRPDEQEPTFRLGDIRTAPAALGGEFVLTEKATAEIAKYLEKSTK